METFPVYYIIKRNENYYTMWRLMVDMVGQWAFK